MNCAEWEERIALDAGGDLDMAGAAEVQRHLSECPTCRDFANGLAESLTCIKEAHAAEIAPAHFTALRARVMASVARERRGRRWMWASALAAAAVVVLALGIDSGTRVEKLPAVELRNAPPAVGRGLRPAAGFPAGAPRRSAAAARKGRPTKREQVLMKIETDNPDVVIFWIADTQGEN